MKKIINYIFLFVVCLLPTVVDAKANLKLNYEAVPYMFLYEEDGVYNYITADVFDSDNTLYKYNKDGEKIGEQQFLDYDNKTDYELYKTKGYFELAPYFGGSHYDYIYDNYFYEVYYYSERINYSDENDNSVTLNFSDDVSLTKKILGKRYDIYNMIKDNVYQVYKIEEFDNNYFVSYLDNTYQYRAYVFNKNLELIIDYKTDDDFYGEVIGYERDGIIYLTYSPNRIDTFKLDGTELESLNIESDLFTTDVCGDYRIFDLEVFNNDLIIEYGFEYCEKRYQMTDANDVAKETEFPRVFSLVYDLEYDVEAVSSSNGEFTYETKEDEDGKSYVELKITPKDGYSVEDIIVTDIYGNRIEVTNNKFYKPLNDVKIEVKYIQGEYLPIPNTALSQSITLIIIGVVLIGLGLYTFNYVRSEEK